MSRFELPQCYNISLHSVDSLSRRGLGVRQAVSQHQSDVVYRSGTNAIVTRMLPLFGIGLSTSMGQPDPFKAMLSVINETEWYFYTSGEESRSWKMNSEWVRAVSVNLKES